MTLPNKQSILIIISGLLLSVIPDLIPAHGQVEPLPTPAESWTPRTEIKGSLDFIEVLDKESRSLFNSQQLITLDKAAKSWGFIDAIKHWKYPGAGENEIAFNREQGEDHLLELMDTVTPSLHLDFTGGNPIPNPEDVLDYNPASRSLLLKVIVTQDGPVSFHNQIFEMNLERYANIYPITVAPTGTSWVMLRLREIPDSLTTTPITFVKEGEQNPFRWHAMTLNIEPLSHLRLDIQDEDGRNEPVLIQISNAETGALWPIADHLDFRPLMHKVTGGKSLMPPGLCIYGQEGSLKITVPGDQYGYHWLVKPPVEVSLPEGDWNIKALRGIEYVPWTGQVSTKKTEWTEKTITIPRWENMAEKGWISGDDHVHSRLMNSKDADKLLSMARAMDIHMNNILEMGESQRTYYTQRGFGDNFRVNTNGYWLVPGMEDPRSILGHNIGLNLTSMVRDVNRYLELDWIAEEVHKQGGLFGQTHVGQNVCEAHRGMAVLVPHELYDFTSIMQGGLGTYLYYDFLDLGYQLNATAGSDMPYGGSLGNVQTYVYTGTSDFTPDMWFDALKQGRTFTTNGPMLEFTVNGQLPGSVIEVEEGDTITVHARAWGHLSNSAPGRLELISLSNAVASVPVTSNDQTEIVIDTDLPVNDGYWIAARSWGRNGSAAHTTPIYIKRKGLRHWNLTRAQEVIDRELAVLDEIEAVIAGVEEMERTNTLNNLDFGNIRISRQKHALRDLLARSRAMYEELRQEAKAQQKK